LTDTGTKDSEVSYQQTNSLTQD